MNCRALALVIAAASLAPQVGVAGEPVPCRFDAAGMLDEDANGDGQVTLLESRAAALALFEHFDRDGDGKVTRPEADAGAGSWREQRLDRRFLSLDQNRDAAVSPGEISLSSSRFARADRDGDGRLSRAELRSAFARAATGRTDTAALRSIFWRRDRDRDGVVTRSEALAGADRRFMRRDRDRDGVITRGGERARK